MMRSVIARGCRKGASRPAVGGLAAGRRAFSNEVRSTAASGSTVYESRRTVEEYLHFHYGPKEHTLPYSFGPTDALDFPERMAAIAAKHSSPDRRELAYDVGCSVGGGTFAMTRTFKKVVGIDFSHAFVEAAQVMKEQGESSYEASEQGVVRSRLTARLKEGVQVDRAEFRQGDACALGDIGQVDCITAVNLLCRLPEPRAFLQKAVDSVRPGGILVLVSPFSWLEEYTPKDKWFGGRLDASGEPLNAHAAVAEVLEPAFSLAARSDEAFLLREHVRKFQWGVSDCTVWRRN